MAGDSSYDFEITEEFVCTNILFPLCEDLKLKFEFSALFTTSESVGAIQRIGGNMAIRATT